MCSACQAGRSSRQDPAATEDETSLKAALAAMLMALGPTEDHKPDSFFIHSLRKAAANEVAHSVFQQIKRDKEAKESEKEIQGVS